MAQVLQRDEAALELALDPLGLMQAAIDRALNDAGLAAKDVDTVAVIDTIGWQPANAAALVAERCSISASRQICTPVGGNTPQALVNRLSGDLAAGRIRCAVIVGANALSSIFRYRKAGQKRQWSLGGEGQAESLGDTRDGSSAYERRYGMDLPTCTYPLFENALRASRGQTIEQHFDSLGRLLAPFSEVAASNPFAWFPTARSASEIATATAANRYVGFPYTKYMNAVMSTDQAAAVVLTTEANASALSVNPDKWVWFLGGADAAEEPWFFSERPSLVNSPALAACAQGALQAAGTAVEDLDLFDLYSCFPVAVELACQALGISETDPRGLTVTGGLPYFGGPGNAYSLHAIAEMAERLRERRSGRGLVTANGWFLTKHSAGVYAGEPSGAAFTGANVQSASVPAAAVPLVEEAAGPGQIETYTVNFDREGTAQSAVMVGRLDGGPRFLAHTAASAEVFSRLVTTEGVGLKGEVGQEAGLNVFRPND